jgi:hypothetical protein
MMREYDTVLCKEVPAPCAQSHHFIIQDDGVESDKAETKAVARK